MKIEKGKLYYDTKQNKLIKSSVDNENALPWLSNKIAVHCPTKEDKEYILNKLYKRRVFSKMSLNKNNWHFDLRNNEWCTDNSAYWDHMGISGYHIITIEQFKEFYPEVDKSIEEIKKEALKSVDDTAKVTRDAGCSEDMKRYIESFNYSSGIDNINPTHYTNKGIQPIDYIEANKLDFNEGNIIKYVSTYKQKNGLEDLKKARYHIDRLIEINSK